MILMDETKRAKVRENGVILAKTFTEYVFRQRFTEFINTLEPLDKQEHRLYQWYRKLRRIQENIGERVSIQVPL